VATTFEWRAARDAPRVRRLAGTFSIVAVLWLLYGSWSIVRGDDPRATVVWIVLGVAAGGVVLLLRRSQLRLDDDRLAWQGPLRGGELAWGELAELRLAWQGGWTLHAETRDQRSVRVGRDVLNALEDAGETKAAFIARLQERSAAVGFDLALANFPESGDDADPR
jgi:hypothetical protein